MTQHRNVIFSMYDVDVTALEVRLPRSFTAVGTVPRLSGDVAALLDVARSLEVELITVISQTTTLHPDFFAHVNTAWSVTDCPRLVYTDYSVINARRKEEVRLPPWSIERARNQNYIGPVVTMHRSLLEALSVDASVTSEEFMQRVMFHVIENRDRVTQVPFPLYDLHAVPERSVLPELRDGHLIRCGLARRNDADRLVRAPLERPCVSIIIPTRGTPSPATGRPQVLLALESIAANPGNVDLEVVLVVDTGEGIDTSYVDQARSILGETLIVEAWPHPFHFSKKVNAGAEVASGEFLLFLNDDVEVLTSDWLDQLVGIAQEPDVGAVGALLRFPNGLVQHAGQIVVGGNAGHAYFKSNLDEGTLSDLKVNQEVIGVTGACLMQRREVWEDLGGLSEEFPSNYNDVDYCLKAWALGYRVVQANSVELTHFESITRDATILASDRASIMKRWAFMMDGEDHFIRDRG